MSENTNGSENPVRLALAGLGRAGWSIHAMGIKDRKDFKLVAAIDPDEARRKEAETVFPGCKGYANWKDFLKDQNKAELVVIATASNMHAPMAMDALKAGLHVLVEKPMAMSVKEGQKLMAVAKKAKRMLTVHQNWRTQPNLHHVKHVIDSGILGKVFHIKHTSSNYARRNDWQTLKKYGGGLLNNHGPHMIDACLFLLDSPVVDVWADLQQTVAAGNCEDHIKIMLRGKNGRVIDILTTNSCPFQQPRWLVQGTLGSLIEEGKEFVIKYLDPAKLPKLEVLDQVKVPDRKYGVIGGDTLEWNEKREPADKPEFAVNFYDKLYESLRGKKKPWVTPESVLEQLKVIEKARKGTKFA